MSEKYTYLFVGKITPEISAFNDKLIVERRNIQFTLGEREFLNVEINIKMEHSLILSECKCDKIVENLNSFMGDLKSYLQLFIDIFGYEHGCAFDLDVITCFDHNNVPFNFWGQSIRGSCDIKNSPFTSQEIIEKLNSDNIFFDTYYLTLKSCFANIREAIRFPNDTPFFCYRAAENIRQFFVTKYSIKGKKIEEKSWKKMWESINVDYEDYFKKLQKDMSAEIRHGKFIPLAGSKRGEIFEKTFTTIDKFIEYAFNEMDKKE